MMKAPGMQMQLTVSRMRMPRLVGLRQQSGPSEVKQPEKQVLGESVVGGPSDASPVNWEKSNIIKKS